MKSTATIQARISEQVRRHMILSIFLFGSLIMSGQTDFKKGHIITNDGEEIHGIINLRTPQMNTQSCVFQAANANEPLVYEPGEIAGYRFRHGPYYVSREVVLDDTPETVFLEFIHEDGLECYTMTDRAGDKRFFIRKEGTFTELKNELVKITQEGNMNIWRPDEKYKEQLKEAYQDMPKLFPYIEDMDFTRRSMEEIAKRYHRLSGSREELTVYDDRAPVISLSAGPQLSMSISNIMIYNGDFYDINQNYGMKLVPMVGGFLEVKAPRATDRASLRFEFNLLKTKHTGTATDVTWEMIHLKSPVTIKLMLGRGNMEPYLLFGAVADKYFSPEMSGIDKSQMEYFETMVFNTFGLGLTGGLGMTYPINVTTNAFLHFRYEYITGHHKNRWKKLGAPMKDDYYFDSMSFTLTGGVEF